MAGFVIAHGLQPTEKTEITRRNHRQTHHLRGRFNAIGGCLQRGLARPPRNSVRLRLSARYDCFARELRDYCEYRLACPIVLDTRKNGRNIIGAPSASARDKPTALNDVRFWGKADLWRSGFRPPMDSHSLQRKIYSLEFATTRMSFMDGDRIICSKVVLKIQVTWCFCNVHNWV
jgi:hypothetical protein